MTDKSRYYIDCDRLNEELGSYANAYRLAKENGEELPRIPDYVGLAIYKIAHAKIKAHNYAGYTYRDDMISEAMLTVVKYCNNFRPDAATRDGKPNSFGYLSFSIDQSFQNSITNEKLEQYLKLKSYEFLVDQHGSDTLNSGMEEAASADNEIDMSQTSIYSDFANKIYDFEQKIEEKKQKQKEKYRLKNPKKVVKGSLSNFFKEESNEESN